MTDETETLTRLVRCRKIQNVVNVPRNFYFLQDHSLIFLGIDGSTQVDNPLSELYYVDVAAEKMYWLPLSQMLDTLKSTPPSSDGSFNLGSVQGSLSKEQELLLERQRLATVSLLSYSFHQESQRLFLPQSSHINVFTYSEGSYGRMENSFQFFATFQSSEGYMDPKWSPDGHSISFVRNGDLWLLFVENGKELRLTNTAEKENAVTCGVAEYVMQEEFDRYTGYWSVLWCPIHVRNHPHHFFLLYLEVDQSMVPLHQGIRWHTKMEAEEIRYPRVAEANAKAEPRVIQVSTDIDSDSLSFQTSQLENKPIWKPNRSIYEQFPWAEYIINAGWLADSWVGCTLEESLSFPMFSCFWLLLLDRAQQHMALVVFDVYSSEGEGVVLMEEFHPQWINTPDFITFVSAEIPNTIEENNWMTGDSSSDVSHSRITHSSCIVDSNHLANIPKFIDFMIASEFNGYSQLYYCRVKFQQHGNPSLNKHTSQLLYVPLTYCSSESTDNLWHPWTVHSIIHVDQTNGFIYFMGNRDAVLERHLYVCHWKVPGKVRRLTETGTNCTCCVIRPDCKMLVLQLTSLSRPLETWLAHLKFGEEMTLEDIELQLYKRIQHPTWHNSAQFSEMRLEPPCLFHFSVENNETLYGCLYLPCELKSTEDIPSLVSLASISDYINLPSRPYPLLLIVYGGPHVQLVSNDYRLTNQLKYQYLASCGVVCMMIDSRGSYRRGHKFESYLYQKFGEVEVQDQVSGLELLLKQGWIDPMRIAVFGWSYGGYLSLMLLAKHSSLFRIAIAGAPVVDWEDYDCAYTERYLGLLPTSQEVYRYASVPHWVDQFPNDDDRLILIHCLTDENVHPQHTFRLIDCLVEHQKPYRLYLFPKERHGLREIASQLYFETSFWRVLSKWFDKH
eukprot:jgi/Galph1/5051/GphlegSOOS_G3766.1